MKEKLLASIGVLFSIALISGDAAESRALSGRDIMLKVDNRSNGNDRKTSLKMILENRRRRKRVRSMLMFSRDYGKDIKTVFYFKKPADVRGTGFLVWGYDNPRRDDDRWLYLPALKRSRRISGSSKNDYFMGSDLTYDDMGNRSVDEDTHRLLKEEKLNGNQCWVIESKPKDKQDMYSKVVSWIRKDALVSVKKNFYDRQGYLLKTIISQDVRKHQGFWTVFKTEVKNVQRKHKTYLIIEKISYNAGLRNSLFRVSTLERGRLR